MSASNDTEETIDYSIDISLDDEMGNDSVASTEVTSGSEIGDAVDNFSSAVKDRIQLPTYGAITIDEENRRFMIQGETIGGKENAAMKLAKGSLAVLTVGMSVLGEKAIKAGTNQTSRSRYYGCRKRKDELE